MINKAVSEGEREATPPALFALMNLLDVLGKVTLCKVFSTELALDLDRLSLILSPGRFS